MRSKTVMRPIDKFEAIMKAAHQYALINEEIIELKKIGRRDKSAPENEYLMWLPRATIIMSMNALDVYIHEVLYDRIYEIITKEDHVPDGLSELIGEMIDDLSNPSDFLRIAKSRDIAQEIVNLLKARRLQSEMYLYPEKIESALKIIGIEDIFNEVSKIWKGPNSSKDGIKNKLHNYCKRRDQIVYDGDLEETGKTRRLKLEHALWCFGFIKNLVTRMDSVIYGNT